MIRTAAVALALAATLQASASHAQSSFPQRDITFIVPWNAGGSNDVAARALDPILREQGIKIVIENVVGATGIIGMRRIASSTPDGYPTAVGPSSARARVG